MDLFVSDYELTLRVIGGKRNTAPGRILVTKLVGDRVVSFDPRYVGDSYIDPAWMSDALRRRRPDGPGGTFVLAPVDHFIGRPGSAVIARILSSEPAPLPAFQRVRLSLLEYTGVL